MATLRSFQNEIEDIHQKELARQRSSGTTEYEKENRNPSSSGSNSTGLSGKDLDGTENDSDLDGELQARTDYSESVMLQLNTLIGVITIRE